MSQGGSDPAGEPGSRAEVLFAPPPPLPPPLPLKSALFLCRAGPSPVAPPPPPSCLERAKVLFASPPLKNRVYQLPKTATQREARSNSRSNSHVHPPLHFQYVVFLACIPSSGSAAVEHRLCCNTLRNSLLNCQQMCWLHQHLLQVWSSQGCWLLPKSGAQTRT